MSLNQAKDAKRSMKINDSSAKSYTELNYVRQLRIYYQIHLF